MLGVFPRCCLDLTKIQRKHYQVHIIFMNYCLLRVFSLKFFFFFFFFISGVVIFCGNFDSSCLVTILLKLLVSGKQPYVKKASTLSYFSFKISAPGLLASDMGF
jgi:hypothetical protein